MSARNPRLGFLAATVGAFALASCGIYETKNQNAGQNQVLPAANGSRISYAQVNAAIIEAKCVRCHNVDNAKHNVVLDSYASVIANLSGIERTAIQEKSMPPRGALSDAEIKTLQAWISDGAPDQVAQSGPVVQATPVPSASPVVTATPVVGATPIATATPVVSATPVVNATPVSSATPAPSGTLVLANFRSIRDQVFVPKCLKCHAAGGRASDYPLDDYAKMLAQGELVIPGKAGASSVVTAIEDGSMPPKRSGLPAVTATELAAIRLWITEGAKPE